MTTTSIDSTSYHDVVQKRYTQNYETAREEFATWIQAMVQKEGVNGYWFPKYKKLNQLESESSGIVIDHFIKDKKLLDWIQDRPYLFIPVQIFLLTEGADGKKIPNDTEPWDFEFRLNLGLLSQSKTIFTTASTRTFTAKCTKEEANLLYHWAKYIPFAKSELVIAEGELRKELNDTIKELEEQLKQKKTKLEEQLKQKKTKTPNASTDPDVLQLEKKLRLAHKRIMFMDKDKDLEMNLETSDIIQIDHQVRDVLKTILHELHIYERLIWFQFAIGSWRRTMCIDTHRWIVLIEDLVLFLKSTPMPLLVGCHSKLRYGPDELMLHFNLTRTKDDDCVRMHPTKDDELPPPDRNRIRSKPEPCVQEKQLEPTYFSTQSEVRRMIQIHDERRRTKAIRRSEYAGPKGPMKLDTKAIKKARALKVHRILIERRQSGEDIKPRWRRSRKWAEIVKAAKAEADAKAAAALRATPLCKIPPSFLGRNSRGVPALRGRPSGRGGATGPGRTSSVGVPANIGGPTVPGETSRRPTIVGRHANPALRVHGSPPNPRGEDMSEYD